MKKADIEKLGKYQILGELGRGAMGVVYKGFDPGIERNVAIKTVRKDQMIADDPDATRTQIERFRREAQAAGRMTHPNIVGVYEYGEDGETAFIAMEFVEGRSLKEYFDQDERFDVKDIVRIMSDLLAALEYSHKNGIVHRDIKPANIMMTTVGDVKITDFGIARLESSSLTQAGTVLGTPSYMSPEQFMGQRVDARSDLFSAGAVLYQFLTGEKPFTGSLTTIMHKVLNTNPEPPSLLNVTIPRGFDAVVAKAMGKRPDDRYQKASDFAQALKDAMAGRAPPPPPDHDVDATTTDRTMMDLPPAETAEPVRIGFDSRPKPDKAAPPPVEDEPEEPSGGGGKGLMIAAVAGVAVVAGGAGWWFLVGSKTPSPPPPPPIHITENPDRPPVIPVSPPPVVPVSPPPVVPVSPPPVVPVSPPPVVPVSPPPVVPVSPPPVIPVSPPPVIPVSPPPVIPVSPPPVQVVSAGAALGKIKATLTRFDCSLLDAAAAEGNSVTVTGAVAKPSDEGLIRQAVEKIAPGLPVKLAVAPAAPVLCDPLAVIGRLRQNNLDLAQPLQLRPTAAEAVYQNGQNLMVQIEAPEGALPGGAVYVQVDYFTLEGFVVHLFPNGLEKDHRLSAGARRKLGDQSAGGRFWTIGPPFGNELIVAIASAKPLFPALRPEAEQATTYLADLRKALSTAGQTGPLPVASGLFIKTESK